MRLDTPMTAKPLDNQAFWDDQLFCFNPLWVLLDQDQRDMVLRTIRDAQLARGGTLPVPSTALIATGGVPERP